MKDILPPKKKKGTVAKKAKTAKTGSTKAKSKITSSNKNARAAAKKVVSSKRVSKSAAAVKGASKTAAAASRGAVKKAAGATRVTQRANKVATRARTVVSPRPSSDLPGEVSAKEVAQERKEVLSGAKKYIYPIAQSRFKIVYTSIGLFFAAALLFLAFGATLLYGLNRIDDVSYRMARIVPYPVSRIDGEFVDFEDYLFEVRQNVHFFSTQDNIDFSTDEGKAILADIKQRSFDKVKAQAVIRQIAAEQNLEVTDAEVEESIAKIVEESNIADGDDALKTTLRDFYDWTRDDFERSIRNQLLEEKVLPFVDDGTLNKALAARDDLRADLGDLETIALERSDDRLTRENSGRLGEVSKSDSSLPQAFLDAAFALQKDEVSEPVETDLGIHVIVRVSEGDDETAEFAHVLFTRKDAERVIIDQFDGDTYEISDYYSVDEFVGDGSVRPDADILPPVDDEEAQQ